MIITMFTWIIMLIIFFSIGFTMQYALNKATKNVFQGFSTIIWMGIAGTTVYAQTWSLFGRVSKNAFLSILILAAVALFILRKQCADYVKNIMEDMDYKCVRAVFFVSVLIVALLYTIQEPSHYDTYLYHAQNIRWIEEYGLVKGLGNFHNRFAYNSSFMCLQALFSFKWCVGQSLHTLNGFLWLFMIMHVLGTLKVFRGGQLVQSDFFKGLILFYLWNKSIITNLSSPHTDMLTLLLVAYIVTNWVELLEDDVQGYFPYSVLCLLGVFATSVKLSAVLVLLFVLKPAVILLREKKWKIIGLFIGSGVLIILPFLIRNVMLSGYLVYPYAGIDLFDVDWKMPAPVVETDNHEIIAWGRLLNDVNRYEDPITVWLPIWLQKVGIIERLFMILNIALVPISLTTIIVDFTKKRYDNCLVLFCCSSLFAGWFFTAPLPRYGLIYLYLMPIFWGIYILKKAAPFIRWKNVWKVVYLLFLICISISPIMEIRKQNIVEHLFIQADYRTYYEMENIIWEGMLLYTPVEGDQGNYVEFPSLPYSKQLERIELRGDDIRDGFRIKNNP